MPLVSINPATGRILKRHREHNAKEIASALTATHQAFLGWRELALADRARHVAALGATLRKQAEPLAQLITAEMGKPLADARLEIEKCADGCEFYAQHAARFLKPQRPVVAPKNAVVAFEPLGVVLAIMPWNYPFWQLFRAAAPALMAGNTVLLKHASNTTGCALAIERIFRDARVPANILRTLAVSSKAIPALIKDARIKGVTLTGSTDAGRKVGALAGAALKPCVFELGGSDPYIILADADLDHAAEVCAQARLTNAGQSCVAAKRFIVVESVRAAFEQKFTARMAARRMGDPTAKDIDFGPLARADLRDELHAQVQKSIKRGARLLLGGTLPAKKTKGAFYPATILTDVRPGMPAYDEEFFGPVASIIAARDEADAIRIANDTAFGLGAAVFTRNRRHGRTLAVENIEAGMVFVNEQVRSDVSLPFGGIKDSGYGRELSAFGIREFVNVKTIWIA
ncbi:MAG: NAD-dependent succinate-semialdehyde dehydrogenase [Rariglobus sp.]